MTFRTIQNLGALETLSDLAGALDVLAKFAKAAPTGDGPTAYRKAGDELRQAANRLGWPSIADEITAAMNAPREMWATKALHLAAAAAVLREAAIRSESRRRATGTDAEDIARASSARLQHIVEAPAGDGSETMRELARLELERRSGAWAASQ